MRVLAILFVLGGLAVPVSAQPPVTQDTTKTREQIIRERLRNLGALVQIDSAGADTTGADTLPAGTRRPIPAGSLEGMRRDSVMEELLKLTGYRSTEYSAAQATFEADSGRLHLRQEAQVLDAGQRLKADSSLTYWEARNLACAYGNPEVSGAGITSPIAGDSLCYNTSTGLGFVRSAKTTVSEGADWNVRGDLYVMGDDYYAHDAKFTDCDLDVPHYHFSAKNMKVVRGRVIVARDVTMLFGDVPVFWVPFFIQSLATGRRSGILLPEFSVNDIVRQRSSYNRRISNVGVYWAINDYADAQLAMDWFSDNWTALRGTFQYRVLKKFISGSLTYRQFWRASGSREFTLSTGNSWEPDERTRVRMDVNYATSSSFVQQNSFDPRELNRSIASNVGVNRRFGWGTVQLNASRNQYLSDNTVNMVLPSVGLNLSSVTLFPALPGEERWYSNATWTASADTRVETRSISDENPQESLQSQRSITGRVSSQFSLGPVSWSQSANMSDLFREARGFGGDTTKVPLPERNERRMDWNTGLSYQVGLGGTSSLTPALNLQGQTLEGDTTGGRVISAPTRVNFSASLQTAIFGLFGGIGPAERIRHRVSPNFTYTYSPRPTVTPEQEQFFGVTDVQEQNRISIGVSQTFEAKLRQAEDTTGLAAAAQDTTGPRRQAIVRPITLLAINTGAVVYDFVQARRGNGGVQTPQLTNNIRSDLVPGLQLSLTHDLFRQIPVMGEDPLETERDFSPHLSRVTASFALSSRSGLFRMLGLGRADPRADTAAVDTVARDTSAMMVPETETEFGMVGGPSRGQRQQTPRSPVGFWDASFDYTLTRPRQDGATVTAQENQQLNANVRFQPTENWALTWRTGYSFTRSEFTDHVLSLRRRLHDFDAHFDFIKAQNGNFSFQFRATLRANPDIKVDYEQRDQGVNR